MIIIFVINMMEITLGHTPDADDAFMFYGIASGKVKCPSLRIKHVIEDIETLNKLALRHELDVTAISAHAYAYLKDYIILRSGGSFGLKYGPIVISKRELSLSELRKSTIAIPGQMTSANLLLKFALGKFKEKHRLPIKNQNFTMFWIWEIGGLPKQMDCQCH
jgi:1,4-dihydroxy-6-naphthoate synthase